MPFATETIRTTGSNLVFVNSYSSSVTADYRAAAIAAEHELQSDFTNSVTITVNFGYANLGAGFLAQNSFGNYLSHVSYSTFTSALRAHATSADDLAAVNALPSTDPTHGQGFFVTGGEARLLGLPGAGTGSAADCNLVLGTGVTWNFDPNNRGAAGSYDAIGAIQHEISEGGMGRIGGLGVWNHSWAPMDLFRFTASGQRDYTGGTDGQNTYFSPNGASGNILTQFHNSLDTRGVYDSADFADWQISGDAFGSGKQGTPGLLSATDLRVLDVLGWTRASAQQVDDFANALTDTSHPFGQVAVNGSAHGTLDYVADRDWFRVTLNAGTTYVLNLQGQQSNNGTLDDPYLRLHSSDGSTIAENDDIVSGVQRDSQIVYRASSSGTYYLEAGAYNDQSKGTYTVSVQTRVSDDYASSLTDTASPFGVVTVNGSATGSLETVGDRDWFKVQLTAGTTYTINLTGQHGGGGTLEDPYLRVHTSSGAIVTENDDIVLAINRDSQVTYTAPSSGTYYLEAGSWDDQYIGTYTVSISRASLSDDFANSFSDTSHPFGQVVNGTASGSLDYVGDRDWFKIQLTANSAYTIDLQGQGSSNGTLADPYLRVYNAQGVQIAENDDVSLGVILDSEVTITASTSGTYYIEAGSFLDSYTGSYRISVGSSTTSQPFSGAAKNYTVSLAAGASTLTVLDKVGNDGTRTITGGTSLTFTDQTVDTSNFVKTAGLSSSQLTELVDLYVAYFNRAPDAMGLDFWGGQLASGASFSTVAAGFASSTEVSAKYPSTLSNADFVTAVYTNVLGRNTDASGFNFWVNALQSGSVTKGNFVLNVVQSVLGQTGTTDAQYIANKYTVGAHFALTQGLSDGNWAKTVMAGVNGIAASVTAANSQTDAFAATAATASGTEFVVKIVGIAV